MNISVQRQGLGARPLVPPHDAEQNADERLFLTAVEVGAQLRLRNHACTSSLPLGCCPPYNSVVGSWSRVADWKR
jgi:hypothetical protein